MMKQLEINNNSELLEPAGIYLKILNGLNYSGKLHLLKNAIMN